MRQNVRPDVMESAMSTYIQCKALMPYISVIRRADVELPMLYTLNTTTRN